MYIKSINNVMGYKGLPDGFSMDLNENINYIIGDNFVGKTTVGSLFNWVFTGTNLYGKERESVNNDTKKVLNVTVDISFVDNFGIEHRLIREKGKEIHITLDSKEIKQEMLSQFYKDKDILLAAHNPYYFCSLEVKQQKDLLRKVIPTISAEDAFQLLTEDEQKILSNPIENLGSYTNLKNEEINRLEIEQAKNFGTIQAYKEIALQDEQGILEFEKDEELNNLLEEYNIISKDFDDSNLSDIRNNIDKIDIRLKRILNEELKAINEKYCREKNKLQDVEKEKPICPSCRQEIKDAEAKRHLINFYNKELERYQNEANNLKNEATELVNTKKQKQELLEKISTPDMMQISERRAELEARINELQEEKKNIELHNGTVQIRQEQISNAKKSIAAIEKAQNDIITELEKCKEQRKIANRLKILIIERQKEELDKYLDKVDIQFSKVYKTTGEIAECFNIQYEGRDYIKLSKSQQIRASLEISNLFNILSGIKVPIFLDDAESTTEIKKLCDTQMIISLVVKYAPLEILNNYEDVLERRRKSIENEISVNNSNFAQAA